MVIALIVLRIDVYFSVHVFSVKKAKLSGTPGKQNYECLNIQSLGEFKIYSTNKFSITLPTN